MRQLQSLIALQAAYAAYRRLGRLPRNAPAFELSEHGYPLVQMGELYCRAPTIQGQCGARLSARGNLITHLEQTHGALKEHRVSRGQGKPRPEEFAELHGNYSVLIAATGATLIICRVLQ